MNYDLLTIPENQNLLKKHHQANIQKWNMHRSFSNGTFT
jgi:hypothetical protein